MWTIVGFWRVKLDMKHLCKHFFAWRWRVEQNIQKFTHKKIRNISLQDVEGLNCTGWVQGDKPLLIARIAGRMYVNVSQTFVSKISKTFVYDFDHFVSLDVYVCGCPVINICLSNICIISWTFRIAGRMYVDVPS